MENNTSKNLTKNEKKIIKSLKKHFFKIFSFLCTLIIFIVFFLILIFCSTSLIKTKNISVSINNFDSIKIVQLSDFNNRTIKNLSSKINELNPDIVTITGDLVDEYKTKNIDENKLIKQFKGINAPIYFVPGDMEHEYKNYENFKEKLVKNGIKILENTSEKIKVNGKEFYITGIIDPSFYYEDLETWNKQLKALKTDKNQILLSHRAELMDLYVENDYQFILSGHTHGGYIKVPIIGAVFASNQGILPKYVDGKYTKNNTTMIVSSGIGVGQFPFRFFSFPKILNIKL